MLEVGQKIRANAITGDHEAEVVEVLDGNRYMIKMTRLPEGVVFDEGDELPTFGPIPEDHLVPITQE